MRMNLTKTARQINGDARERLAKEAADRKHEALEKLKSMSLEERIARLEEKEYDQSRRPPRGCGHCPNMMIGG